MNADQPFPDISSSHTPFPYLSRRRALKCLGLGGLAAMVAPASLRANELVATPSISLSGKQPGFYRFRIGDFEAIALNDGGFSVSPSSSPFGVGVDPTEIEATLDSNCLHSQSIRVPFNVLLVRMGSELLLVDTGCGSVFGAAGGRLISNLADAGIHPSDITSIIITHAHGDHIGGLMNPEGPGAGSPFPNAKLFITRKEYDFWTSEQPDLSGMLAPEQDRLNMVAGARRPLIALKDRWQRIQPEDQLFEGVEILDAAGHTPGHIALLFSSGNDQLLHMVDTAHHHVLSVAQPNWKLAFDALPELAVENRHRIFDRAAADRLRIFGAHMPFPALGRIRRDRSIYQYLIEPWEFPA